MEGTFEGHSSKISSMQWLDTVKNRFVTSSYDRTIRVWSVSELKEIFILQGHLAEIR